MEDHSIDILMPVFNGERHLVEQLDSILNQSFTSWKLVILDDCSSDRSREILQRYSSRFPSKIEVHFSPENRGVVKTISSLLEYVSAPYVALADQDDIWDIQKLELCYRELRRIKETPALVFSDLEIFDSGSRENMGSFWGFHKIFGKDLSLSSLLTRNIGTGCTFLFSSDLVLYLSFPSFLKVHDWWILLNAYYFGKVQMIHHSTVLYRVHEENSIGVSDTRSRSVFKQFFSLKKTQTLFRKMIEGRDYSYINAKLFLSHIRRFPVREGCDCMVQVIDNYAKQVQRNWFLRRFFVIRYSYFSGSLVLRLTRLFYY